MTPYEIYLSSPITQIWLRKNEPPAPLTPEQIVEKVCGYFGFAAEELKTKSRKREKVVARQVAMVILCQMTPLVQEKISEMFNRERTAVVHAYDMLNKLIEINDPAAAHYETIRIRLNCPPLGASPIKKFKARTKLPIMKPKDKYSNTTPFGIAGNY